MNKQLFNKDIIFKLKEKLTMSATQKAIYPAASPDKDIVVKEA
jgi:hypothetical protein